VSSFAQHHDSLGSNNTLETHPNQGQQDSKQHDDDVTIHRNQKYRLDRQIILNKHLNMLLQQLQDQQLKEALINIREILAKVSNVGELKQILTQDHHSPEQDSIPRSTHWRDIGQCWNELWQKQFMDMPSTTKQIQKLMRKFETLPPDEVYPDLLERRIHLLAIAYFIMDTDTLIQRYIEMRHNDVMVFSEFVTKRRLQCVEAFSKNGTQTSVNDQTAHDAQIGALKVQSFTQLCSGIASMIEMDHHSFNRILGKWRPLDRVLKAVYIPPLIKRIGDTIDGDNILDFVDTFDAFMDFRRHILSTLQIYLEVHQSVPREIFENRQENVVPVQARPPQSPLQMRKRGNSMKLELNRHPSEETSGSPSSNGSSPARKRRLSSASVGAGTSPSSKYRPAKPSFTFTDTPTVDVVSIGDELLDAVNTAFIDKVANFHDSLKAHIQELGGLCVERQKQQLKEHGCFEVVLSPSSQQETTTYISAVCSDLFTELSFIFQRLCRPMFSDIHPALFDTAKSIIQSYAWYVRDVMQKRLNSAQSSSKELHTLYIGCNILAYVSNQCSVLQRFQTKQIMENTDSFNSLSVKFSVLLRSFVARIVQKHLNVIQRYITIDIEASEWQSFRVFQGESRCNYGIEMWYFYVRGVAHDVRAKCRMNTMLSSEIIGHLVAHSMKQFLIIYESIFPSRIRTKQLMGDISYIIHFTRSFRSLTSSSLMNSINRYCIYLAVIGASLCCPLTKVSKFLARTDSEQAQRSNQFARIFELNQSQLVSIIPPNIWLPDPVSIVIDPMFSQHIGVVDDVQEDVLQIFDYHSSQSNTGDFHASMWNATYDWDALLDACHFLHMGRTSNEMIFRLESRHEFVADEYPELNDAERMEAAEVLEQIQSLKRGLSPVS